MCPAMLFCCTPCCYVGVLIIGLMTFIHTCGLLALASVRCSALESDVVAVKGVIT